MQPISRQWLPGILQLISLTVDDLPIVIPLHPNIGEDDFIATAPMDSIPM
jgi:hypothetical protein